MFYDQTGQTLFPDLSKFPKVRRFFQLKLAPNPLYCEIFKFVLTQALINKRLSQAGVGASDTHRNFENLGTGYLANFGSWVPLGTRYRANFGNWVP